MMFHDDAWGATQDGYDTIAWIADQSWSDGTVCITGASAVGMTSMLGVGSLPPVPPQLHSSLPTRWTL